MFRLGLTPVVRLARPATPAVGGVSAVAGLLPAFALLVIGFWQVPFTVMKHDLSCLPGGTDNRLNTYVLEHGSRWLAGREKAFWSAPFCWPSPKTIARSDAHLGELPAYAALRACGLGPERAFQCVVLLFFALNYAAAYWAARRFGLRAFGAAAAAYLFAFGLATVEHLNHLQLLPRCLVPPAFYFFWRTLRHPGWRPLAGLAACGVGQLYLTMYLGVMTAGVLAALFAATLVASRGRLPWAAHLRPGWAEVGRRLAVVAVAALLALPVVRPHVRMASTTPPLSRETLVGFIPDAAGWACPPTTSAAWAWARPHLPLGDDPYRPEKTLFLGVVPWLAVVGSLFVIVRRPRRGAGLVAACALVAVAVPLVVVKAAAWSPYEQTLSLPLVGTLRAVGRVVLVLLVPVGLLVGFAADALTLHVARRFGNVGGALAGAALLVLLVFDQRLASADDAAWDVQRYAIADAVARREALAAVMREGVIEAESKGVRGPVAYVFPRTAVGDWDLETQLDSMAAAQSVGVPTLNGWTGYPPAGWYPFASLSGIEVWLRGNGLALEEPAGRVVLIGEPRGLDDDAAERGFRSRVARRPFPAR